MLVYSALIDAGFAADSSIHSALRTTCSRACVCEREEMYDSLKAAQVPLDVIFQCSCVDGLENRHMYATSQGELFVR